MRCAGAVAVSLLLGIAILPGAASAEGEASATPEPGKRQVYAWASTGPTFAYGETLWSASVGVGYHVQGGLAPNVEVGHTFFNTPTMWILRPGITWFIPIPFRPYVGGYFVHWFVSGDHPDRTGIGFRAGISLNRIVSLAVTYDHAINCSHDCNAWTPELAAGIAF